MRHLAIAVVLLAGGFAAGNNGPARPGFPPGPRPVGAADVRSAGTLNFRLPQTVKSQRSTSIAAETHNRPAPPPAEFLPLPPPANPPKVATPEDPFGLDHELPDLDLIRSDPQDVHLNVGLQDLYASPDAADRSVPIQTANQPTSSTIPPASHAETPVTDDTHQPVAEQTLVPRHGAESAGSQPPARDRRLPGLLLPEPAVVVRVMHQPAPPAPGELEPFLPPAPLPAELQPVPQRHSQPLPIPDSNCDPTIPPTADPLFADLFYGHVENEIDDHTLEAFAGAASSIKCFLGNCVDTECAECDECSPCKQLFGFRVHRSSPDVGIGEERVMFAPFAVDVSQPFNRFGVKFENYYGIKTPDSGQYIWAGPPLGPPKPEISLDYQDLRFHLELGGDRFSMTTEVPLRLVDPVVNGNTTGVGDMVVFPKIVLVDGRRWQLTHSFRTYTKIGTERKGLGNGHVSLEPGLVLRYKWTERTYLHWEARYWFAAGADPDFSGEVFRYGFAISTIAHETDTFAILPTLELAGWTMFDGLESRPDGTIVGVDDDRTLSLFPGVRFVLGPAGDLGLFELGISGGISFRNDSYFDNALLIDARFSF